MNFDTIWCWLIPLLFGAVCAILGYLWGKRKATVIDHSDELDELKGKNSKLQADLDACTQKLSSSNSKETETSVSSQTASADFVFDASAAKSAFGKRVKKDDLKIVEGIGPKIEGLFHNATITTWKKLSEASVNECQEILNSAGDRYRIHDPSSWPMQAKMAHEGKWKQLVKWQDEHKSGKF